ncbi:prolyl oligopeptidase family serine peptidase [Chungangia koreensis]|uniref:Prolyl oligopeptidase family serine peptidase n=1 Tax=Chungangia koreensis TaxID=752657 RepID=A0ABV8X0K6_9LACT
MEMNIHTFEQQIQKNIMLNYIAFLPDGYDPSHHYPLLVFLHGIGERGKNPEKVMTHGIPQILEQSLPFILICPQCPDGTIWSMETDALDALLDEVITRFPIDENRMYLTGLSMGGYGTWDYALRYPDRFAALAPVCGGTLRLEDIGRIKHTPIWVFHGELDKRIPAEGTRQLVRAMESVGGNIKATYYPEVGHNAWVNAYSTPELYEWLLQHERKTER